MMRINISQLEQRIIQKLDLTVSFKLLQELISLGFEYALQNPINLNLEDFNSYFYLSPLLRKNEYLRLNFQFKDIFNSYKNLNTLMKISNKKIYKQFFYLLTSYKTVNPFYSSLHIMMNTGAKANWNQIRQLIGLRGYLMNARGFLFKIPVMQSFNKGLKAYEYFISCYGARKGILDTSLKTANAGYLTRRLVESIQEIVIKEYNCGTNNFFTFKWNLSYKGFLDLPFYLILYGKTIQENIKNISTGKQLFLQGFFLNYNLINKLKLLLINNKNLTLSLNSIKLCLSGRTVCSKCFGFTFFQKTFLSQSMGVLIGESIGEPVTQMTLRTFHTGGISSISLQTQFFLKNNLLNLFLLYKKKNFKICKKIKSLVNYNLGSLKYLNFEYNKNFLIILNLFNKKNNLFKIKFYSIFNKYNLDKTIFYFLKYKFLYLFYTKSTAIYSYKFPFYFLLIKFLYQRNFYFSCSLILNKTKNTLLFGEILFQNSLQYLIINNFKKWIILHLQKTLVLNKCLFYYPINLYNKGLFCKTSFNLRYNKLFIKNYKILNFTFKKYFNKKFNNFLFSVYINYNFKNKFLLLEKRSKFKLNKKIFNLFGKNLNLITITNSLNIQL
ncbi:RNA polymerase C2, putative (apicoplast) [Toxoplasma gondii RUB]|uniref:DNA-directed RNA polymerase n=4 Tax=Toxoplasma gondii TaxID=5811 RepID=A0A086KZH1_TOXGO|nr:putative RNA polymerase C2 [Toxoplasma gondii p89]KFG27531.1 putative RNA polymerase C2 [Toxoplasma gondii FOU]KFG49789.1 RNA polymerase C2, putative [Toxoplasma gondii RUB]